MKMIIRLRIKCCSRLQAQMVPQTVGISVELVVREAVIKMYFIGFRADVPLQWQAVSSISLDIFCFTGKQQPQGDKLSHPRGQLQNHSLGHGELPAFSLLQKIPY